MTRAKHAYQDLKFSISDGTLQSWAGFDGWSINAAMCGGWDYAYQWRAVGECLMLARSGRRSGVARTVQALVFCGFLLAGCGAPDTTHLSGGRSAR